MGGRIIPTSDILEYERVSNSGGQCHHWVTRLADWEANTEVTLEVLYNISEPIYDGIRTYPAGGYQQIVEVQVR